MAADRAADAARLRRELSANPRDAVAWHNLGAAEGDLGNAVEAEAAAARAIALGIAAPETRLVLARAYLGQGRLDEAEKAFEAALAIRPGYAEAHRDLAQLRWMRTGDAEGALAALRDALRADPRQPALHLVRSIALEFMGDMRRALADALEGLQGARGDSQLLRQAAHLCAELGEGARALQLAEEAFASAPDDPAAHIARCEALLAAGRPRDAEAAAEILCRMQPLDQHAIALRTTAWRLLGDTRYRTFHDYAALVASRRIAVPGGWPSLDSFLADVRTELEGLHAFRTHPFQQSVRGGSQLPLYAAHLGRPALAALFEAIESTATRWLASLGDGSDPFRPRRRTGLEVTGAWSVRLFAGGFHSDHVHPRGWLSGVFYVDLPPEVEGEGNRDARAGWLRLGRPGIRTQPELPADAFVKPERGVLVLFPAYVWHGVQPFDSPAARLSVAFDALPA